MPLPTRPPECGMMRSPLVRMAATTATLVPCHSSLRLPSLEWAWNLSPWGEGRGNGEGSQAQGLLPAVQRVRPRPKAPLARHTHSGTRARDLGLGEADELLNRLADGP